ncbi:formimidoylglutamase [Sinomonas cyclohexanicum]|uniref:Formimidoylglutamase n=1 Tax=Sinomonas cyclohexanicum TaxID=322009 RepID=A0ABN6FCA6_SINCY|nr:formimidoylglutamase [Corynebacterium cyclohexanicum]BCT74552.1 formimidoylglutamase [Corynebacterium cyclohexanicum]
MSEAPTHSPAAPARVDIPCEPWSGRNDGDSREHRRWWQAARPHTPGELAASVQAAHDGARSTPAVLLGFRSEEGVRRNKGRLGAAEGPAAIRAALGPLAFHLDRDVFDAGDVTVVTGGDEFPGDLEGGQERFGAALAAALDAGALTVGLGGGHETAFASYLGVAGSERSGGVRVGVLNLDAHFDLRAEDQPTSGTPFLQMARAEAAEGRTLQYAVLGISRPNNTRVLFDRADELGVRYLLDEYTTRQTAEAFVEDFLADLDAVYLTIDLDVLPAAVAPGVSAPAAVGVPLEVIIAVVRRIAASGKLLHADIAELNPSFDIDGRTAKVAARLVDTILG